MTMSNLATPKELRLLQVIFDPANVNKSKVELADLAGISRKSYYDMFKRPGFVNLHREYCNNMIKSAVPGVLAATIREAMSGSYQDRKMLLELAGTYNQKLDLTVKVKSFEEMLTELEMVQEIKEVVKRPSLVPRERSPQEIEQEVADHKAELQYQLKQLNTGDLDEEE